MAGSVAAAAPVQVALVENVSGNPAGVEFMDYLETGKIIELGPHDTIVLSYMSSCVQETITRRHCDGRDRSERIKAERSRGPRFRAMPARCCSPPIRRPSLPARFFGAHHRRSSDSSHSARSSRSTAYPRSWN